MYVSVCYLATNVLTLPLISKLDFHLTVDNNGYKLKNSLLGLVEAGVDEAGRGPLVGAVFAAAVVLPLDFYHPLLRDSKQMTARARYALRPIIEQQALAWAVAEVSAERIDEINILQATFEAMNEAVARLSVVPELLIIDGPRFKNCSTVAHRCIIHGDGLMSSIAAASVLAKTYRDDYMLALHERFPQYGWNKNMGYPTRAHRQAIALFGPTPYHRRSFKWL
ncbi:MAG: ribonuclease HII [Mucinivorans sp.]